MLAYIVRRVLLMVPTILGIMALSFAVVQFAPGGPIERVIAQLQGTDVSATERFAGGSGDFSGQEQDFSGEDGSVYRGAQGLDPEFIAELERQFGFDKPPLERFALMIWNYARFDFGESYFRDVEVIDLIIEKLPVSISLGLWMTLLSYGISIPLGIAKAVKDGTRFDIWTSAVVIVGYAIPGFLFAILLIVLFRRRIVLGPLPAHRPNLRELGSALLVAKDPGLLLASHPALDRDGRGRLCDHDAAHQELVPR
jgi:microcin C transport system permease protein